VRQKLQVQGWRAVSVTVTERWTRASVAAFYSAFFRDRQLPAHLIMSSVEDFKAAVKDSLAHSGALAKMQAQVRAQIVTALDDTHVQAPVRQSSETYLVNELVREYLELQGYRAAASVFGPEAGLAKEQLGREVLADRLQLREGPNTRQLPLLYALTARARAGAHGDTLTAVPADRGTPS
jgi:FOP N terminal dimerisation domain